MQKKTWTSGKTYQVLGEMTQQETYVSFLPKLIYKGNMASIKNTDDIFVLF